MCKYCNESINGDMNENLLTGEDHTVDVFIDDEDNLELYIDQTVFAKDEIAKIKINFCPMCGRKLTKEA